MVLLPECRAEEVRHVLSRVEGLEVEYDGARIPCRFSRGWTDYKLGESSEEFLKRADEALYANKRAGKERSEALRPNPVSQPVT
jgi:PleD family two-component response regulator